MFRLDLFNRTVKCSLLCTFWSSIELGTFWKESEAFWSKLDQNRKERPRLKSGTSMAGILFVFGCHDQKEELGREETKSVKNRPLGWHCQNWTPHLLWIESSGPKIGDIYCRGRILKVDCFWKVKRSIRSCGTESEAKWPSRIHKLEIFSFVKNLFMKPGSARFLNAEQKQFCLLRGCQL